MALSSGTVAVGTAATQINGADSNPIKLHIANNDNTDAVYIGGAEVTFGGGLLLSKQERMYFELNPGERLFAISNKAGHVVSWIEQST